MSSVLLVFRQKERSKGLTEILKAIEFDHIDYATSGSESRRRLQEIDYDMVIIYPPLSDEFGVELALDIMENYGTGVILMVKEEWFERVEEKVCDTTIFVIGQPVNCQLLIQNIKFVLHSKIKMQQLKEKNSQLQQKMNDLKIIYRAKLCLMHYLKMTESQAHRYIQKQAMDMRRTPRETAEHLIKMYER